MDPPLSGIESFLVSVDRTNFRIGEGVLIVQLERKDLLSHKKRMKLHSTTNHCKPGRHNCNSLKNCTRLQAAISG